MHGTVRLLLLFLSMFTVRIVVTVCFSGLLSCAPKQNSNRDFMDKAIDLAIETSDSSYVQFPELYDSLTSQIPDDAHEKLIMAEKLKQKGFQVTRIGRGNFPPLGPRIVDIELTKENCLCTVSKIYYATVVDTLFQMTEGIRCRRK